MTGTARTHGLIWLLMGATLLAAAACRVAPFTTGSRADDNVDNVAMAVLPPAEMYPISVPDPPRVTALPREEAAPRPAPPLPRDKPAPTLTVAAGDTVVGIARRYGVEANAIIALNELIDPYWLQTGQRLRLPAGTSRTARRDEPAEAAPGSSSVPLPPTRNSFLWPVEGRLISGFGSKPGGMHNDGINIAAPVGSDIRAAQTGVVAYAGNELRGYGNLVLIRHDGGWMTAYAHNDSLLVGKGDVVRRGQVISLLGTSGRISRPQSHFEIRRNGIPQDPLSLLTRE